MSMSRVVSLTLGTIAVTSSIATLSFDLIFASTLSSHLEPNRTYITAIVASTLGCVTVVLLLFLFYKQVVYRSGAYVDSGSRQHTYLFAGFGGVFGIMSSITSAVLYGMVKSDMAIVPRKTVRISTEVLVTSAFGVWAVTLLSQALFVVSLIIMQRRLFQEQTQPYLADSEQCAFPEMKEEPRNMSTANNAERGDSQSIASPQASDRSRSGSEARSFRSSLSHVVRPINSKTKLIPTALMSPNRTQSMDSSHQETRASTEDGFDSWDFSSVDPHSRKMLESSASGPQRGLPTIPASPTGSRSSSPGFAFDLQPPETRRRSRSYSPAPSVTDAPKNARTMSPTKSTNEGHIHPLFRSDSPTPPPAASAATMVVAAVGGGQMLKKQQSIRSIQRMRSGSLDQTPPSMQNEPSLEDLRRIMEREEWTKLDLGNDRVVTPPIPDFVLFGGARRSLYGYNARKDSKRDGEGRVGG